MTHSFHCSSFFFFNDTATTEIYTLSLHDALPISEGVRQASRAHRARRTDRAAAGHQDRKSTRLNSSHTVISYAVFCLKKKKNSFALVLGDAFGKWLVASLMILNVHLSLCTSRVFS